MMIAYLHYMRIDSSLILNNGWLTMCSNFIYNLLLYTNWLTNSKMLDNYINSYKYTGIVQVVYQTAYTLFIIVISWIKNALHQ